MTYIEKKEGLLKEEFFIKYKNFSMLIDYSEPFHDFLRLDYKLKKNELLWNKFKKYEGRFGWG